MNRTRAELIAHLEQVAAVTAQALAIHDRIEAGDHSADTIAPAKQLRARLLELHDLPPDASSEDLRDATDRRHREVLAALGLPEDYVDPVLGLPPAWPGLEEEPRP